MHIFLATLVALHSTPHQVTWLVGRSFALAYLGAGFLSTSLPQNLSTVFDLILSNQCIFLIIYINCIIWFCHMNCVSLTCKWFITPKIKKRITNAPHFLSHTRIRNCLAISIGICYESLTHVLKSGKPSIPLNHTVLFDCIFISIIKKFPQNSEFRHTTCVLQKLFTESCISFLTLYSCPPPCWTDLVKK